MTYLLILFVTSVLADPNPLVLSREYKVQLDLSQFTGSDPSNAVNNIWSDVQSRATALGCSSSGSLSFDKTRTINFYDTPNNCLLKKNGFVLRARRLNDDSSCTNREVTLKYLSADRYNSSNTDVSSASKYQPGDCYDGIKFEEDINPVFENKYSNGNSVEVGDGKNINEIQDIFDIFPNALVDYNLDASIPLAQVSGLTIYEKTYKGGKIGLPTKSEKQAKFTLTLWYDSPTSTTPFVSELSFTATDKDESWQPVISIQKIGLLYNSLQQASYARSSAVSKTQATYLYNPSFCGQQVVGSSNHKKDL